MCARVHKCTKCTFEVTNVRVCEVYKVDVRGDKVYVRSYIVRVRGGKVYVRLYKVHGRVQSGR